MTEDDCRFEYLYKQVSTAFRHIPSEKLREFWFSDSTHRKISSFLDFEDRSSLFIKEVSRHVLEIIDHPSNPSFYLLKIQNISISSENIASEILYGDITSDPITHLSGIAKNLYIPMVNNANSSQLWNSTVAKDISDNFEVFLSNIQITEGHLSGISCLPLPSYKIPTSDELAFNANDLKQKLPSKSLPRVHELENMIIIWTKQMKNILRQDSEDLLLSNAKVGPLDEVEFWRSKARNLNGIFKQLQNPVVRRIIHILDVYKSTYNEPFIKLCKEISNARIEANEILKYLHPLSSYLSKLDDGYSFEGLINRLHPIFCILLKITSYSVYYNTPARITVMLRLLGNVVIQQTVDYLTSENISLTLFDSQPEAIKSLSTAIKVINQYKDIFKSYQSKAMTDLIPPSPAQDMGRSSKRTSPTQSSLTWSNISITAIFFKLDQFLERCHDIYDLTQTIQQFLKLNKIEIGGTKGKSITSSVDHISSEFLTYVDAVRHISATILEFENKVFDEIYYKFCYQVKQLDRRLASILLQGFDDAATIHGKFRLLETFDNLIFRPIISDALEKKYAALIESIMIDFREVERIFVSHRENIPIPSNLPLISGALMWTRGLFERVKAPIDKLNYLDNRLLSRDDGMELLKLYGDLVTMLADFDQERIEAWGNSIESSSEVKLKNPLLRREYNGVDSRASSPVIVNSSRAGTAFAFSNGSTQPSILRVNFDPFLVRLLREVKYFLLLGFKVPPSALEIYQLVEVFRQYTGNLELIVNMYNDIQLSLLPVERPLIKNQLDHIDRTLSQGIGDYRAVKTTIKDPLITAIGSGHTNKTLNWKSSTIDSFISEAMMEVRESMDILHSLKGCLHRMEQIVDAWQCQPIFDRSNKVLSIEDFYQYQQKYRHAKLTQIKESGHEIHRILKETNKKLKISQVVSDWKAYVDFINNFVADGLTAAANISLEFFGNQLNPKRIEIEAISPMIEIQLDLDSKGICFVPEIASELPSSSISPSKSSKGHSNPSKSSQQSLSTLNIAVPYPLDIRSNIETSSKYGGVKDVIHSIVNGMLSVSSVFKRIDTSEGNYFHEVGEALHIKTQKSKIFQYIDITEKKCQALKVQFRNYDFLWLQEMNEVFQDFLRLAVMKEKVPYMAESNATSSSQSYLSNNAPTRPSSSVRPLSIPTSPIATNPSTQIQGSTVDASDVVIEQRYWLKTIINTDLFGEKITYFTNLLSEISEIRSIYEIDFLRVNAQPIKQALFSYATKWLYMYTSYLQSYVSSRLLWVYELIRDINKGLDQTVESGSREAMMSVMMHIRDIRKYMPELSCAFEPLKSIVILLKVKNIPLDLPLIGGQVALDFLEQASMQWDNTVNKAYRVKENLQPLQLVMIDGVKKEIKAFDMNVMRLVKDFISNGPFQWLDLTRSKEAYGTIDKYYTQVKILQEKGKMINELQDLFELPISAHLHISEFTYTLQSLKYVWDIVCMTESLFESWKSTTWQDIQTDDLIVKVKNLDNQLKQLPKQSKEWMVYRKLEVNITNMSKILPLINDLHSSAIRDRHWKQLLNQMNPSKSGKGQSNANSLILSSKGPSFCLNDLLQLNLHTYSDVVADIVEMAQRELKIENRLNQIETKWNNFVLSFDRHRDTEVFIVSPPDEILDSLEENHLHLQSMAGMGRYIDYFRDRVSKWQTTLGEVESTLKLLLCVEKQWGSLESIFLGSADIRAQLPEDTKRFETVDNEFKEVMKDVQAHPGVILACTIDGREQLLRQMFKELEKCEKALNEYLEIRKNAFPRFFFVSNAALLDILSNGNNPVRIMPHLGSIFDGISDLELCLSPGQIKFQNDDPENYNASTEMIPAAARSIISKDNEIIVFSKLFEMKNSVENWLHDLVKAMHMTLKNILGTSMSEMTGWIEEGAREEWVFTVPTQIALVTSQIVWTDEVETALEEIEGGQEESMRKYEELCTQRLESMITLVQGKLSKEDRMKIITIITIDVHNRDIVKMFVTKKVDSNGDFNWQSQLRYYWVPDDKNVSIKICDYSAIYSYEYVGNCGRLVITPLTDRCYVTLTTALRLNLGGAPSGPAGTGKTETTKDLARGLGLPCYVFNCSDQMNYQTMGDIFKGLAQVGAWGCFDEFNRIDVEVLSVVASQVRCILDAIAFLSIPSNRSAQYQYLPAGNPPVKVGVFNFFDEQISLIPTVGLFITMNPGYAGRTELPENLKLLFRSCAMVQPDTLPICENMLMAEGFVRARPLALKFVTLYKLSSELLSKQNHYDWGLRAIKSVLRVAGILKRSDPDYPEEAILMRALRDFNTPKIPNNDLPIFLRLISDIFPGLDLQPKVNGELRDTCIDVCKAHGLQSDGSFISKVLQYQELLEIRHSVMILGPAGAGKTTVWKTLALCHNHEKNKPITVYDVVNPKSITTDELYGYMTLTKDWKDGALSIIMRNMSTNTSPYSSSQTSKWVVLDGDIDAIWIESMNSVMDDNKVLTLVSNERIPLNESMRMIFEVHSLEYATPATVSRAGILYINDTDIGYEPFVDSWLQSRGGDAEKSFLSEIFDRYLHKVIDFYQSSKLETIAKLPLINLVQSLCYLLDGMIKSFNGEKSSQVLERIFLFCLMWAFGGALTSEKQVTTDFRKVFSIFFKSLAKSVKFPDIGQVFDFFIDPATGEVIPWQRKLESTSEKLPTSSMNYNLLVTTTDSIRLTHLMDTMVRSNRPVMFVGPSGTGKTILVSTYLSELSSSNPSFKSASMNMNYYTDSNSLQHQLEEHIDKRSGKAYGPPSGKLIFFIDDLNLPEVELYGTQTPLALIRQYIDHKSWFDRNDLSLKKTIVDCQLIACMNHKNGSFTIDPRLQRHFMTIACQMPSESALMTIFQSIIHDHFVSNDFDLKTQQMSQSIAEATINLLRETSNKFLPSAIKFHYNFNMRDVMNVLKGMLLYRPMRDLKTSSVPRLWYHEVTRVFSDRFVNEMEINKFHDMAINIGRKYIDEDEKVYLDPCLFTHLALQDTKPMFPYQSLNSVATSRRSTGSERNANEYYSCAEDLNALKKELERYLHQYNETHNIMNLVLFDQAISHICRIMRILRMNGNAGNALLIGVGGSGKQSLSRLAAFICGYDVVQLSLTSDYTLLDFKEQLRDLYRKAAVKPGNPIVFILTDTQIIDERFLVYLNDFLNSGKIYDLFSKEEYDNIFNALRNIAKAEGVPDNRDLMMDFFIDRVRMNLHIVLCMSPVGETFRQRARKFPGIINCTSIDWFHEWKKDALVSVALKYFEDIDIQQSAINANVSAIVKTRSSSSSGRPASRGNAAPVPQNATKERSSMTAANSNTNNSNPPPSNGTAPSAIAMPANQPPAIPGLLELREQLAYHIAEVHTSVSQASKQYFIQEKRYNYTTPKSFLELISLYKTLLSTRRNDMAMNIKRLEIGLETLIRTNNDVNKLQEFLKEKKKEVENKKLAAEILLEEMGRQRQEAETQQILADNEKSKADEMAEQAKLLESQAAGDLAIAKPVMDAAHEAIDCLDKASMTELRSFTKPPVGIDKVTSVLLIMIKNEKKDFSWENAKKMMAKVDAFKEKLEMYPSEDIPDDIIARVAPYLEDAEFTYDRMKSKSSAAANLTNWILNTIAYNEVYKRVKPLMDALDVATKAKKTAEDELGVVKEKLAAIEAKLMLLQQQFTAATSEKAKVEQEYKDLLSRLSLAERLTSGLSTENERWDKTVETLKLQEQTLIGDVMLAASFVTYIGAFSSSFRGKLWKDIWLQDILAREIPISGKHVDPLWILATESQTAAWQNESLPSDRMSLESGAIIKSCSRWPLLIDPQLQGLRWLKNHLRNETNRNEKNLIIIQCNEKNWMKKIIAAVQVGDTVILEGVTDTIDASLSPLLSKSLFRKSRGGPPGSSTSQLYLKVGDEDVAYDESFQLFLHTKLSNPHYKPDISAQCTIINFTVTQKGLEDQLLATIVSEEEPELEKSRNHLIQSFNSYKIQLKELEDNLLERLANAPADILNDTPLIEGLEATKLKVNEINDAVKRGTQMELGINQTREIYRPVALEASLQYFLLLQLSSIDYMYQYSLDSFMYFFLKALRSNASYQSSLTDIRSTSHTTTNPGQAQLNSLSSPTQNTSLSIISGVNLIGAVESKLDRVKSLQSSMRWIIYNWATRGLFAKHRLIFLAQLTLSFLQYKIINGDSLGYNANTLQFLLLGTTNTSLSLSNQRGQSSSAMTEYLSSPKSNSNDTVTIEEKSPVSWISNSMWSNIRLLSTMESFEKLANDILENSSRFLEWYQSLTPETEKLPGDWRDVDKHMFKKLLVIRVLRPDRITSALTLFIREVLPNGKVYTDNDSENSSYQILEQIFQDSTAKIPIYFIVSPGADVVSDVDKLALKCGKIKGLDYHNISLGQGQDSLASERLEVGHRQGHWIFLNNIHLMPRWLPILERKLDEYNSRVPSHGVLTNQSSSSDSVDNTDTITNYRNNGLYSLNEEPMSPAFTRANTEGGGYSPTSGNGPNPNPLASNTINMVTHADFRIFLSSDPSTSIPLSLLDRSIKITSDPPTGLKANLKQALSCFSRSTYDDLEPRSKGILFGLCQFHAIMIERKKFGAKGFNMQYPFNVGDLTCSFLVLKNYMESVPAKIPWIDLRYIFGEIMYGGHIVNNLDRLLSKTYLDYFMKEELLDEMVMYPYMDSVKASTSNNFTNKGLANSPTKGSNADGNHEQSPEMSIFKAPPTSLSHSQVLEYIDDNLKFETPIAYGLHSNAEIGYRTSLSDNLLQTILDLSTVSSAFSSDSSEASDGEKGGRVGEMDGEESNSMIDSMHTKVESLMQDITEMLRDVKYDIDGMVSNIEEIGPFQNILLQECDRMNRLVTVILKSISELEMGYKGELTMSEAMEELANSLVMGRVPKKWEASAYPSLRSLGSWILDLNSRITQLNDWSSILTEIPVVTWIGGLFNPQSFLTAIMQIYAQVNNLELDKLTFSTEITKKMIAEEITVAAKEGVYIYGLNLEGGSWNVNLSLLEASKPKEMYSPLPVIHMKPAVIDRIDTGIYVCPVYKTQQRGNTYVISIQLKTKHEIAKWILAGVVGLMDVT